MFVNGYYFSDFHLERMKAALTWVLGLKPSLLSLVNMEFISIPTSPSTSTSTDDKDHSNRNRQELLRGGATGAMMSASRQAHEKKGVAMIERLKTKVTTVNELEAYLLLGGHRGLRNYVLNQYQASSGGGW